MCVSIDAIAGCPPAIPAPAHVEQTPQLWLAKVRRGFRCRGPEIDDANARSLEWRHVTRCNAGLTRSSDRRDLGVRHRDRMAAPAGAYHNPRIRCGRSDIKRQDPYLE